MASKCVLTDGQRENYFSFVVGKILAGQKAKYPLTMEEIAVVETSVHLAETEAALAEARADLALLEAEARRIVDGKEQNAAQVASCERGFVAERERAEHVEQQLAEAGAQLERQDRWYSDAVKQLAEVRAEAEQMRRIASQAVGEETEARLALGRVEGIVDDWHSSLWATPEGQELMAMLRKAVITPESTSSLALNEVVSRTLKSAQQRNELLEQKFTEARAEAANERRERQRLEEHLNYADRDLAEARSLCKELVRALHIAWYERPVTGDNWRFVDNLYHRPDVRALLEEEQHGRR